jgi:hypothetical protein
VFYLKQEMDFLTLLRWTSCYKGLNHVFQYTNIHGSWTRLAEPIWSSPAVNKSRGSHNFHPSDQYVCPAENSQEKDAPIPSSWHCTAVGETGVTWPLPCMLRRQDLTECVGQFQVTCVDIGHGERDYSEVRCVHSSCVPSDPCKFINKLSVADNAFADAEA